jgi:hypothetical protein
MSTPGYIVTPVLSRVYTRLVSGATPPPTDGSLGGWTLDNRLLPIWVRHESGPRVGRAEILYVPRGGDDGAFETALERYTTDDQVKIVAGPVGNETVLFEGVISRLVSAVNADASGESEGVSLVAEPMTVLDNEHPDHIITGPWFTVEVGTSEHDLFVTENPLYPAIFNFRGRPNRAATRTLSFDAANGTDTLNAYAFAPDGDSAAEYWTVADAILSLLCVWLYGPNDQTPDGLLARHFDVASDVLLELERADPDDPTFESPEFFGLRDPLPETSVHGLGIIDALHRVCEVAGFSMSITPIRDTIVGNENSDRRHQMRIWRRHSGPLNDLDLAPRGSTYGIAADLLAANNLTNLNGVADGSEVVNHVRAAGPTYLEVRLPLKPLWDPADVFDPGTEEPVYVREDDPTQFDADLETPGTYPARHVVGGVEYHQYGHVGRAWGIDCTGSLSAGFYETPALYQHDPDGFDFLEELGLKLDTNGDPVDPNAAPIFDEREDSGLPKAIEWSKRVRHILPLRDPRAIARGVKYHVEASEDAGASWKPIKIGLSSLPNVCGVRFDVSNLAATNRTEEDDPENPPPLSGSWWGLIDSGNLTFRITCVIEADHSMGFIAPRQASSGSRYNKHQYMPVEADDCWLQPGTVFALLSTWARFAGYAPFDLPGGEPQTIARAAAEQRRRFLENRRVALTASVIPMDFGRYNLGERIEGINGRGVSFRTNEPTTPDDPRYPDIVGITYRLAPESQQQIQLTMEDQRMVGVR